MGILDNDTVIVDAILTKLGRQKLANGRPLGITRYAFGDTGVDYTLYNPNHPSGSDSYGSAITSMPMMEAVPDDNVFLRFRLYGQGERNVQNFSFITITSGTSVTIIPQVFPSVAGARFNYKVLDMRGITVGGGVSAASVSIDGDFSATNLPPFDHPDPVIANITNLATLTINAQPQQITTQRSIGVEVTRDGAAAGFVTVTVNVNNTTT